MTTYWDANTYDAIAPPMQRWADDLLREVYLQGHETVLDAGCGSGIATLKLAEKIPSGQLYAVDSSREMIGALQARLAAWPGTCKVTPVQASLTDFSLPAPVDYVFSNAVFHWITNDAALFGNLHRATRPGGMMRAQCGGAGNLARVYQAVKIAQADDRFRVHFVDLQDGKIYRSPLYLETVLKYDGWRPQSISLFEAPVPLPDAAAAVQYLRAIVLRDHVARLPEDLRQPYLEAVVEAYGREFGEAFVLDYVRVDFMATRI